MFVLTCIALALFFVWFLFTGPAVQLLDYFLLIDNRIALRDLVRSCKLTVYEAAYIKVVAQEILEEEPDIFKEHFIPSSLEEWKHLAKVCQGTLLKYFDDDGVRRLRNAASAAWESNQRLLTQAESVAALRG